GRFAAGPAEIMERINASIDFDKRLYRQDIRGSIAHCQMLVKQGIISATDGRKIVTGLRRIEGEIDAGNFAFSTRLEDIHMNVEARLKEVIGDPAGRLHTARSRNDQVATDVRLWASRSVRDLRAGIARACAALATLAERELKAGTVLPGFTHLQRGQPVLMAHWCLAYVEMLRRDDERFADALRRIEVSPLGSGALAGTAYAIDRAALARDLGFGAGGASRNSLDAVSDRDFVFETLSAAALCGLHLSRLGEDLVVYSSAEFGFVQMADRVTSGSSLMPQKKNPDAAELIRGKSGRLLGNLVRLAATLKGLPLAYNKDLQEDKEPLFDSVEHLAMCLAMVPECLTGIRVDRARCRAAADDGFSAATDLADYLVRRGVPFRDAHHTAGRLTRLALERGVALHRLTLEQMRSVEARIGRDIYRHLEVDAVVAKRNVAGGTAPAQVRRRVAEAKAWAARRVREERGR
ncbi:MAG: argininosuccinate lyase, partial [Phycisphaeraceae bacterium]|nr:argininosuccinate lyase [Phycisphaeraceae bacterium]